MMKYLSVSLLAAAMLATSGAQAAPPSYAKHSAEEIMAMELAPEKLGLEIVKEADLRDFGFGDFEVELEMTLRNAHNQESTREQRNQTFEMVDPNLGDKTLIIFDRPRDVKGTAFLTYSKILEPDDQWLYLPSLKRVKRIASKNKSGPFVGSEFAYEDISSQEVAKYTYKYLKQETCPTAAALKCFVVERYPAYEYSGYSKQISWIDTEHFRLQKVDFYDRKQDLLKSLTYAGYQQYLKQYWRADQFLMVNKQTGKSTDINWKGYKFRTGLSEDQFTKNKLKNTK
ncbi:MAG: outer membrane lipoprotein-sorting protein [Rickettsiales bacterium]|nr:outer membrane lipoprotein-sorting protein [Rickettsiales bacterium]